MSWNRSPVTFIPLDLGCQQWRPSVCAYVPVCACLSTQYSHHSAILTLHMLVSAQSAQGSPTHILLIAVFGHPMPNPKVHRCGLSQSGSGEGPEVWAEACLLGAMG